MGMLLQQPVLAACSSCRRHNRKVLCPLSPSCLVDRNIRIQLRAVRVVSSQQQEVPVLAVLAAPKVNRRPVGVSNSNAMLFEEPQIPYLIGSI